MNQSDYNQYHQTDWEHDLKHKHSAAGKRERKIRSLKLRGKKWYARKGLWAGLFVGLFAGLLIHFISMDAGITRLSTQMALQPGPTRLIHIDGHPLTVELAASQEQRRLGLMNRESLPDNTGMLFVWPSAKKRTLWMKDTPLPLSLAFISENGEITEILDLKPFDETQHSSQKPARYALEVNQGWFDIRNIEPGAIITLVGEK